MAAGLTTRFFEINTTNAHPDRMQALPHRSVSTNSNPICTAMPPIVSFIGKPDCGKTTLLEKLIPELKAKGYRVGTIKHHVHEFEMDKPGKDTWKHKKAGAHAVALSSPTGLGVIRDVNHDQAVQEIADRYFYDVDLIITEGYKQENLPKIEIFRKNIHDRPLENRNGTWAALVSDTPLDSGLPEFDPNDIQGIADFLVTTFIKRKRPNQATLIVDGKVIPLNAFVETFIRQAVKGMTTSLKGCRNAGNITITIYDE